MKIINDNKLLELFPQVEESYLRVRSAMNNIISLLYIDMFKAKDNSPQMFNFTKDNNGLAPSTELFLKNTLKHKIDIDAINAKHGTKIHDVMLVSETVNSEMAYEFFHYMVKKNTPDASEEIIKKEYADRKGFITPRIVIIADIKKDPFIETLKSGGLEGLLKGMLGGSLSDEDPKVETITFSERIFDNDLEMYETGKFFKPTVDDLQEIILEFKEKLIEVYQLQKEIQQVYDNFIETEIVG